MTEEQLNNSRDLAKLLLDNGFVMQNAETFFNNVTKLDEGEINKLVNRLLALEETMNKQVDLGEFTDFVKEMPSRLDDISNAFFAMDTLDSDPNVERFTSLFGELTDKFRIVTDMTKAERIVESATSNYNDILKRIKQIDKEVNEEDKMLKAFQLRTALSMAEKDLSDAKALLEEKKNAFDNMITNADIEAYREELLTDVNRLYRQYLLISDNKEKSKSLGDAISKMQNDVVILGQVIINSKKEYAKLCEEYGISSIKKKREEIKEAVKVEETKEEPVIEEKTDLQVNDDEIKITTVFELADVLRGLNPDKIIAFEALGDNMPGEMPNLAISIDFPLNDLIIREDMDKNLENNTITVGDISFQIIALEKKQEETEIKKPKIENVFDLVNYLKELNPGMEIKVAEKCLETSTQDLKIDESIMSYDKEKGIITYENINIPVKQINKEINNTPVEEVTAELEESAIVEDNISEIENVSEETSEVTQSIVNQWGLIEKLFSNPENRSIVSGHHKNPDGTYAIIVKNDDKLVCPDGYEHTEKGIVDINSGNVVLKVEKNLAKSKTIEEDSKIPEKAKIVNERRGVIDPVVKQSLTMKGIAKLAGKTILDYSAPTVIGLSTGAVLGAAAGVGGAVVLPAAAIFGALAIGAKALHDYFVKKAKKVDANCNIPEEVNPEEFTESPEKLDEGLKGIAKLGDNIIKGYQSLKQKLRDIVLTKYVEPKEEVQEEVEEQVVEEPVEASQDQQIEQIPTDADMKKYNELMNQSLEMMDQSMENNEGGKSL